MKNDISRLTALMARAGMARPEKARSIAAAASTRKYYRMELPGIGSTIIGAIGRDADENRAFVTIARAMEAEGIAAPRIIAVEEGYGAYIMTDLGDRQMMDAVKASADSGQWDGSEGLRALEEAMRQLPKVQYSLARRVKTADCYPRGAMDRRSMMWDLSHFKYCFLKAAGAEIDEDGLEDDFEAITDMICAQSGGPLWAFILRDCQSRNVMLTAEGYPQWIDFQGGRMGPVAYDVASMVWHARARIPASIRSHLVDIYLDALRKEPGMENIDRDMFEKMFKPVLLLRYLQVLGAYGLRGLTEGNAAFITPLPGIVGELEELLPWMESAGLRSLARQVRGLRELAPVVAASERRDELVVTVMSFSYKKGMPHDFSGNGGGFVFDCRYPDNPGRQPAYRSLTGMDEEVIKYIEADGELTRMVNRAIEMVTPAVETYRRRGFTHLSVAFGCTGGQHRSVYGAEHMAEALAAMGVRVHLVHREQKIDRWIPD
ncbi:MAG: phosphotransferase [Pseudoflavonifractor sp.]|nr:phosphotransferase [Alloprevotella sp.]MCM1116256.1 phosphotransferase [Pseudoflavonifractor sp.]